MIKRTVHFTLAERDVVSAMQLASSRKIFIPIPVILAIGVATVVLAYFVFGDHTNFATDYLVPLAVLLMIMVVLIQYIVLPWQARGHYRQSAALSDEITLDWGDEGLRLSGAHGEAKLAWLELHRWSESPSMLLVYHSELLFHMIPKRALSDEQIADLTGKIEAASVKKR